MCIRDRHWLQTSERSVSTSPTTSALTPLSHFPQVSQPLRVHLILYRSNTSSDNSRLAPITLPPPIFLLPLLSRFLFTLQQTKNLRNILLLTFVLLLFKFYSGWRERVISYFTLCRFQITNRPIYFLSFFLFTYGINNKRKVLQLSLIHI